MAERTRSRRAGLGEPLKSSKTLFSSRRKSSLGSRQKHLLHGEVAPQPLGGPVDARLGGGRGNAERPRHLVERKVEIEVQNQREPLVRTQPEQCLAEVGVGLARPVLGLADLGKLEYRPPRRTPGHPALVGHDGQEPRPQRGRVPPQLLQLAPGLDRSLLDGVFGGGAVGKHDGRSEEHTSELQSRGHLVCRLLLEKKKKSQNRSRSSRKANKLKLKIII